MNLGCKHNLQRVCDNCFYALEARISKLEREKFGQVQVDSNTPMSTFTAPAETNAGGWVRPTIVFVRDRSPVREAPKKPRKRKPKAAAERKPPAKPKVKPENKPARKKLKTAPVPPKSALKQERIGATVAVKPKRIRKPKAAKPAVTFAKVE